MLLVVVVQKVKEYGRRYTKPTDNVVLEVLEQTIFFGFFHFHGPILLFRNRETNVQLLGHMLLPRLDDFLSVFTMKQKTQSHYSPPLLYFFCVGDLQIRMLIDLLDGRLHHSTEEIGKKPVLIGHFKHPLHLIYPKHPGSNTEILFVDS